MGMKILKLGLGFLLFLAGCQAETAKPGEEGGPCQVGPQQCAEGLSCQSGLCLMAPETSMPPEITVDFFLELENVQADGESSFFFELMVTVGPDDAPYDGELYVYPEPLAAGEVTPRPMQIEDGLGLGTYTACQRGVDLDCPEFVRFIVTNEDDPLVPFAASSYFRLVDQEVMEPSPPIRPSESGEQNSNADGSPEDEDVDDNTAPEGDDGSNIMAAGTETNDDEGASEAAGAIQ